MNAAALRALLLPVVAAALVVVAAVLPGGGDDDRRPPRTSPVTQATYACPAGSVISVAAGQVRAGTSADATALPSGDAVGALGGAGGWRRAVVAGGGVVVEQQGSGSGAVGFFSGTAPKAGGGGLVVGPCPGVVDDSWLLGLGSGEKHFSTLVLTNLADTPAAADLTLWGPQGPIEAVDGDGVVVEPRSVRRIRLDELAAGEPEVAVHVRRLRGSLSAVVNDTSTATFRGTEPISATATPRRDQVVGGLVKGTSGRTLLLLNPGTSTARVTAEVVGADGTFAPSGLGRIKVGAGRLKVVTVPRSAGADEQALHLVSDEPVAATVRMSPSAKDHAYAEATPVLDGPAVVPIDLGTRTGRPRLVLSAPRGAATVTVERFDADMASLGSTTVRVAAGTTTGVLLEAGDAAYAVVRSRGPVVGAVTYTAGDRISSLALGAAPVRVLAPQVRPVG